MLISTEKPWGTSEMQLSSVRKSDILSTLGGKKYSS